MRPARPVSPSLSHSALLRFLVAAACSGLLSAAQAGPSNLWTDNMLSESQVIPLTTPNQGLARARLLMADGDYLRATQALNKIVARWPTCEEALQLRAVSLQKLREPALAGAPLAAPVALGAPLPTAH